MPAIVGTDITTAVRCAVFKVDLRGNLIYIDDETEELSGLSRDELFGKSIYDFIPDDCRHLMENILGRPKRHDMVYQAWPLALKTVENEREEFLAIVTLNFIGESPANYQFILIPGVPTLAAAPSEHPSRESMSPSFSEQLSVLGRAGDALQIGVAVVDESYAFLYTNDYLVQTLTPEGGVFAPDLQSLWQTLQPVYLSGEPVTFAECDIIRAIREQRFAACHGRSGFTGGLMTMATAPLKTTSPVLSVILCISEAVSGGAAESRYAAARKLVCAMAHDLRAPLITMEAFSRKLSTDHSNQLDDKGRFALSCLTENARILHRMIDGLGELAANWTAPDRVEKVAVGTMIDDLVTMLRATYPETEYVVESGDDLPVIEAPRGRLVQVFRNILDNAFKYSKVAAHPRITITHRYENGWHRFSIGDNGPGIDKRYHTRIFEPFFRTPEAGAGNIPGTGMGLAIVHDIITGWGGYIRYEFSSKAESVFVFGLPGRVEG